MALTVITTPGAANANSYASVVEGDAYHESMPAAHITPWTDADPAAKGAALVMATRVLDGQTRWAGEAANSGQALLWPRIGLLDHLRLNSLGSGVVPQQIKNATIELARHLLVSNRTLDSDVEAQGIKAFSAGPVSFTFRDSVRVAAIVPAVYALIPSHWILSTGQGSTISLERV
jgi:hypothetical protein